MCGRNTDGKHSVFVYWAVFQIRNVCERMLAQGTYPQVYTGTFFWWIHSFRGLLNVVSQCKLFLSMLLVLFHSHLELVLFIIMWNHLLLLPSDGNRCGVGEEEQRVWLTWQGTGCTRQKSKDPSEHSRQGPLGSLAPESICSSLNLCCYDFPWHTLFFSYIVFWRIEETPYHCSHCFSAWTAFTYIWSSLFFLEIVSLAQSLVQMILPCDAFPDFHRQFFLRTPMTLCITCIYY